MSEKESEFGRGLLVCLLGFLDHKCQIEKYFDPAILERYFGAGAMWANGASDHLYELKIPLQLEGTPLAKRLRAFQEKWLDVGHGFVLGQSPKREEVLAGLLECERLALEVAAEMDKILGLPDAKVGQWT